MKIYVLEEYNTGRTVCISDDINMIRNKWRIYDET